MARGPLHLRVKELPEEEDPVVDPLSMISFFRLLWEEVEDESIGVVVLDGCLSDLKIFLLDDC